MLRRRVISILLGCVPSIEASPLRTLDRFLPARLGCALLLDVVSQRIIATNGNRLFDTMLIPPGSTLKPLSLDALLSIGKLRPDASYLCPQKLILAGRRMDCSHPSTLTPMRVDSAIAYSCNCFTAHAAERLESGELARYLQSAGLTPAEIAAARTGDAQQLQALGESNVLVTPLGLAHAYRQLALGLNRKDAGPGAELVLAGMEGSVEFGTGQLARVKGSTLAGKTGSTRNGPDTIAWFAGFLPSRAPQVVVTVMLSGKHGGSDAAPIAGQILEEWRAGHL